MWAFYRAESNQCATKLASLHDASASLRHQLHRKLGTPVGEPSSTLDHAAGDERPPASTAAATASSLLDDPSLQYSSPVLVSTGGVLRPTPQVGVWRSCFFGGRGVLFFGN